MIPINGALLRDDGIDVSVLFEKQTGLPAQFKQKIIAIWPKQARRR